MAVSDVQAEVACTAFSKLPAFSALFQSYTSDFERLAHWYNGDYRTLDGRKAAAERAAAYPRNREALADALLVQNEQWGLDAATQNNIEALRQPDTVVVITGQQVAIFSGPLYTIYKIITTLQLARQVSEETGRTVVPMFWLPGEDHDLAEVVSTRVLHGNGPKRLTYQGHVLPADDNLGPVGQLKMTEAIRNVVDELAVLLPPTDFREQLIELVRSAYSPGTSMLDAYVTLLKGLFPDSGLVFISPNDAALKELAIPLFAKEINDFAVPHARIKNTSDELVAAGFHAQVATRPTNLFWLEPNGRYPIDVDGDCFSLRGQKCSFTRDGLLALLHAEPERFSPNVVLRPLMQDYLLPTVAYVAGPGETAYFAQYKAVYEWAGIPMPLIYPRASVTLLEGKIRKVLDRYEVALGDLDQELDKLFRRLVLNSMDIDVNASFRSAMAPIHKAINDLKPLLTSVDQSLVKSGEATRAAIVKEIERLKQRVIKAEKRNHDIIRSQLEKAQVNLYPDGTPQERALNVLYFLNKYSPSLIDTLMTSLSTDTTQHQVVYL